MSGNRMIIDDRQAVYDDARIHCIGARVGDFLSGVVASLPPHVNHPTRCGRSALGPHLPAWSIPELVARRPRTSASVQPARRQGPCRNLVVHERAVQDGAHFGAIATFQVRDADRTDRSGRNGMDGLGLAKAEPEPFVAV
jgi:hypothetical protein